MAETAIATEGKAEAIPAKNKGGRPKKPVDVDADELARLALGGSGRKHLAKLTGITEHDARTIVKVTGMTVEEFQEDQRKKMQVVADMALARTQETIGEASALQSATVYGILADKMDKQPKVTNNLHVHLKEADRGDLLTVLMGRQQERRASVLAQHDQNTKEARIPGHTGPVIDITPTE
jgi:hypothetical protein